MNYRTAIIKICYTLLIVQKAFVEPNLDCLSEINCVLILLFCNLAYDKLLLKLFFYSGPSYLVSTNLRCTFSYI